MDGKVIVDYIGRFERLQECFDEVSSRLGLAPTKLPHLNASRHAPYTEYYSATTAEEVRHLYARDIKTFGYKFGQ
jgi:hypothetical protein